MPRDHARVNLAIWQDSDFRNLTVPAQHLYLVLWSHPSLSYCGVADFRPGKLAAQANGWTKNQVMAAAEELSDEYFIVVDEDTEEVLIRSWIKFDGLLKQPRLSVSMANAYADVASNDLRGVLVSELGKLFDAHGDWAAFRDDRVLNVMKQPSVSVHDLPSFGDRFGDGFRGEFGQSLGQTLPKVSVPPTPSPSPSPYSSSISAQKSASYPPEFESFWKEYPRKDDKRQAFKAWKQAIQRESMEVIEQAAARYRDDPNRDEKFTKYASTWLNADAWDNKPLPQREEEVVDLWAREGKF